MSRLISRVAVIHGPVDPANLNKNELLDGVESVKQTAYALTFFSLGLAGQAATALLVRVFYALQNVMTPLRISLVVIATSEVCEQAPSTNEKYMKSR